MTNPAEQQKQQNKAGIAIRNTGIIIALISALLVLAQMGSDGFAPIPWLGLVLGVVLVVVGYLQVIAAK